jgi:hypothetical protein
MLEPNPNPYRRHTSPPTHFPQIAAICPVFQAFLDRPPCHTDGAARTIVGVSRTFDFLQGVA